MALRVGEAFAGYTVIGQLGGGGMGEVYLAQHPRLPRQDALKILKADISADEGFRQRFIREADSVAALSHPNIVTVFDRGEFNGKLWIATEYVNGTDAAQLLRDRYPAGMPAVEAAAIAAAIGDALDYAHERGLLHRDVKPANILLSEPDRTGRRRVFLADFGIARPMGDPSGLTATNFTVGTVSYAAPEQLMGAGIDGRADQYALAATAFHLLAGKPPFEDSNPIAVISKHLTLPPPQLGAIRPDLSGVDHILATAMAKEPNQRYPHCADFTADLTHGASLNLVLPHASTQAALPAPVPSTPVPGPPANQASPTTAPTTTPAPVWQRPPRPPAAERVAPEQDPLPRPRSRRRISATLAAAMIALTALGIGFNTISNHYYVSADGDDVAIMRGIQGSFLGIPLQQLYFIGCLNRTNRGRGELSLLHRRGEVFARASFDTQQADLNCEAMKLQDLQPSERPRVIAGLPSGSMDDATNQLRELARKSLLPVCTAEQASASVAQGIDCRRGFS